MHSALDSLLYFEEFIIDIYFEEFSMNIVVSQQTVQTLIMCVTDMCLPFLPSTLIQIYNTCTGPVTVSKILSVKLQLFSYPSF